MVAPGSIGSTQVSVTTTNKFNMTGKARAGTIWDGARGLLATGHEPNLGLVYYGKRQPSERRTASRISLINDVSVD